MTIFKKENTRKDFGFLFEYLLEKHVLHNYFSDDTYFSNCMQIIEEYSIKHYGISWKPLEELFEDINFINSIECIKLVTNLVQGLSNIPLSNLSWEKTDGTVDGNFLLDYIFEHPDLPYYYILHNDHDATYILIDKNSGNDLPFNLNSILPSYESNIICGRFEDLSLDSDEYYKIKFDNSNPENNDLYTIVRIKDLISIPKEFENSIETVIHSSIQVSGSNVPLKLIPLEDESDIIFKNLILDQKNKMSEKQNSGNLLPF